MKLQTVKLNILIPLEYNKNEFEKSLEKNLTVTKKQAENFKKTGAYGTSEWFHYCFRQKPIEANRQNAKSPMLTDREYLISRIELNSVVRTAVGLHKNENAVYLLPKLDRKFRIGKIRVLFTRSKIAFLHIEITASDLTESAALRFINFFSNVTSRTPQFEYVRRLSKEASEIVKISLKALVQNIVKLQSYLALTVYENPINPYFQICMIGTGEPEEKERFFDSVRSLSKRLSSKAIDDKNVYLGKEQYVSRFVGDRAACIFGDIGICGEDNLSFITDIGNGLVKTATENYLTAYAFLVSLQIIVRKNDPCDPDIKYLLNASEHISDEDNIREFFEKCLWDEGWHLRERISLIRDRVNRLERPDFSYGRSVFRSYKREAQNVIVDEISPTKNMAAEAYSGKEPYIFLSYSHDNFETAMDIVCQLQTDGFRVWYDEELVPGCIFDEVIASHVKRCGCFIPLFSREYLDSAYCMDEIIFALNKKRTILPIYLEDIQLSDDLDMRLSRIHASLKYEYKDRKTFYEKLYDSHAIIPCRCSAH